MPDSAPSSPAVSLHEALSQAVQGGLDRIDAQMLLLHALGRPLHARAWLIAHDQDVLDPAAQKRLHATMERRRAGEPLAYITGHKEFYGLTLSVDARVLDPRPDTETLVDWALTLFPEGTTARIVDLGTGSGAIALALQQARPDWKVHAIDRSHDALAVARHNAQRLQLPVQFMHGNWLDAVDQRFDAIVSNPPYIADQDPHLQALMHEPRQALTSGPDGLDDIRRIVEQAPACLAPGGWLLLEHGYDQAGAVCDLLRARGFADIGSRRDLAGIERCSGGCWRADAP